MPRYDQVYLAGTTSALTNFDVRVEVTLDIESPQDPTPMLLVFVYVNETDCNVVQFPLDRLEICSMGDFGDEFPDSKLTAAIIESLQRLIDKFSVALKEGE